MSDFKTKDFLHVIHPIGDEDISRTWERAQRIVKGYMAVTFAARYRPYRLAAVYYCGELYAVPPPPHDEDRGRFWDQLLKLRCAA
jgi:hypothetical protein